MFVGGEFYADERWRTPRPTVSTAGMMFLSGGRACLKLIGNDLLARGIREILLPEYLCPTIIDQFTRCGLSCAFYQVRENLSIDLEDLAQKAAGYRAVLFINYFGFFRSPEETRCLQSLQRKGLLLVEDNAQAGFSMQTMGDYVFNSLRKFCPHDGGYLIAPPGFQPVLTEPKDLPSQRLPLIRAYRQKLRAYLLQGVGDHAELVRLFQQAEEAYENEPRLAGDAQERCAIEHIDWQGIKQIRRENYQYLLGLIASIPEVEPILPVLQPDTMPLGLPVYIHGVPRERLIDALGEMEIGLTTHWDALLEHPRTRSNPRSTDLASRMLTLVIDQRNTRKQLDYLALSLVRAIEEARG